MGNEIRRMEGCVPQTVPSPYDFVSHPRNQLRYS